MNTTSYKQYLSSCKKSIEEQKEVKELSFTKVDDVAYGVFRNINRVKKIASDIKTKFINNITDNLVKFDKIFTENGGNVHWCVAYNDFIDKFIRIIDKQKIKTINVFDSNFIEELGLKGVLKNNEITVDNETNDVVVFTPKFGVINTGSLFFEFASSFDMEQVLSSRIKIFVLPINDFVLKPEDIEIFSYLYYIYKYKKDYPYLTSLYTPQPLEKQNNIHIFLIDNGRSNILENREIRSALNCINCDACKEVCPIYTTVGDEPYDNVFSGPYANVVLPFLENVENYKHICFSCTGCGNCSKVCPMNIPISEYIISNKNYFFEKKIMDITDARLAKSLGKTLSSRESMNKNRFIKNLRIKLLVNNSKNITDNIVFSKFTFNQQYQQSLGKNE